MLLRSKNDESNGNKTFEVYYTMVASNVFKQAKTLIDNSPAVFRRILGGPGT